jgi:uncharacterized protein (TIGR03437 family)
MSTFYQLSPAAYAQAVANLQSQISTLSDAQFYVQLAALIAMAGDPHTFISLTDSAAQTAGFLPFPLQFRWLDDGVFVTAADPYYAQTLGTQLVAVGGTPIAQVVQQLGTLIPHANNQWLDYQAQQYLTGQQVLQGLNLLPASPTSALTFQTLSGEQITLQVGIVPSGPEQLAIDPSAGPLPDYLQQANLNYWYTYSAANQMLYFKYNVCEDDPNNPFAAVSANILTILNTEPVNTIVLDFRGNTGGNSEVINPLLQGLFALANNFLSNPLFRAYDVIDKGTFSSGMDDAMDIKSQALQFGSRLPPETFLVIGEATGGDPTGYGNVIGFSLPASGLYGQYSTEFFDPPPGIPSLPSFMPDIPITVRSTDFFARYDPIMGAILASGGGAPTAPSGAVTVVNGASFRIDQGVSAGSYASAFGAFGATPDQVTVNGAAAQLVFGDSLQVNFIVPASITAGTAGVSVFAGGTDVGDGQFTVSASGPGIFVLQDTNPAQPGAVENQDYAVNSSSDAAAPGSVIILYGTGYGQFGSSAQVFFGDTPAQVLFSGQTGEYPGLWQLNVKVPDGIRGQIPVFVVAGNLASNAVTVAVE